MHTIVHPLQQHKKRQILLTFFIYMKTLLFTLKTAKFRRRTSKTAGKRGHVVILAVCRKRHACNREHRVFFSRERQRWSRDLTFPAFAVCRPPFLLEEDIFPSLLRRGSKVFFSGGEDPLSNVSAGTELQATAESAGASARYHAQDGRHPEAISCGLLAGVACVPCISKF